MSVLLSVCTLNADCVIFIPACSSTAGSLCCSCRFNTANITFISLRKTCGQSIIESCLLLVIEDMTVQSEACRHYYTLLCRDIGKCDADRKVRSMQRQQWNLKVAKKAILATDSSLFCLCESLVLNQAWQSVCVRVCAYLCAIYTPVREQKKEKFVLSACLCLCERAALLSPEVLGVLSNC